MLQKRLKLSTILNSIPGVKKVYFSPPTGTDLEYPCIVYRRSGYPSTFADNHRYLRDDQYRVIVIDTDPDTSIPDELMNAIRFCSPGTEYITDGLYHFPFTITL